jgi:ubiquinone/menaquinone biosynthesis C-methylase UbiE
MKFISWLNLQQFYFLWRISMTDQHNFSDSVQEEWTSLSTVKAWRKWHEKTIPHLAHLTKALVDAAKITSGCSVLDLASGSGEPAITIANLVGPAGKLTATDFSNEMLEIAKQNAQKAEMTNIVFKLADAHDLPEDDESFDVVTCRLGVMYFWDCQTALREIRRVLKPGGVVSFVAWGDVNKNGLARSVIGPFAKRKELPALPPTAPQPFRFAREGSLTAELESAGFSEIEEQTLVVPCPWPGPPAEFWHQVYDLAVPLQPFFNSFDSQERQDAIDEVISILSEFYDGTHTDPSTCIVVARAVR